MSPTGTWADRFLLSEHGATAVEYAFIAMFVSIAVIGSLISLGAGLEAAIENIADALANL